MQPIGMWRKRVEKKHISEKEEKKYFEKKKLYTCIVATERNTSTQNRTNTNIFYSTMQNRLLHLHATDPILLFSLFFLFFIPNEKNQIKHRTKKRMTSQMETFPQCKFHIHASFNHYFQNGNNTVRHFVEVLCILVW